MKLDDLSNAKKSALIASLTKAFGIWRDSGKISKSSLDAVVTSTIAILEKFQLDSLVTHWKGYDALPFNQAEYKGSVKDPSKAGWSPYNGSKAESENNALPCQMLLKNVRRMTDIAITAQLEAVINDGKGWGRLSRDTSFTGSRTDSRLTEEVNKERMERMAVRDKTLVELVESNQSRLEAKRAEQAARKAASRAATPPVEPAGDEDTGLV